LAILGGSFRLVALTSVRRAGVWRPTVLVLLIVPLLATSCGSSAKTSARSSGATLIVRGPGFRFSAPVGWRVRHTPTSAVAQSPDQPPAIVSAAVYRLGKAYAPDDFGAAASELDGVAAKLARAVGGKLTARETTTVSGRKIRAYRFTAQPNGTGAYADRVGFVLFGKREIQLLCQAPAGAGDPGGACALLFASFELVASTG
jgi:hypothetical protein